MEDTKLKKPFETSKIAFTPEQMELVQQLILASRDSKDENSRQAISRFSNIRDPKAIMSIPTYRFDEKFVVGFKNYSNDPYRKVPKFYDMKLDINRKLNDQPFVTLLLSTDGETITEKEVPVIDYINNRIKVILEKDAFEIVNKEVLDDKGIIGRGGGGTFAQEIGSNGIPISPVLVKAEVKRIERKFIINFPGFIKPVEMIEEFLA